MYALDVQHCSKVYQDGTHALDAVDLSIEEGDFFALLGSNGAGKTTLISMITSLLPKTAGSIKVFGHDINTAANAAKSLIGLVPQEFNFNVFQKVEDVLLHQAGYFGIPRHRAHPCAEKLLKQLDLWHKRHTPARALSGGMKRRLMVARALIHQPKLLILDEPTAGVDVELRRSMWQFLKEINTNGTTIILTTHYLEEAEELCKNLAIIHQGKIVRQGRMRHLLQDIRRDTLELTLAKPRKRAPNLKGFNCRLVDETTVEIDVCAKDANTYTGLLTQLSQAKLPILQMRSKTNRLEELFVDLIEHAKQEGTHHE